MTESLVWILFKWLTRPSFRDQDREHGSHLNGLFLPCFESQCRSISFLRSNVRPHDLHLLRPFSVSPFSVSPFSVSPFSVSPFSVSPFSVRDGSPCLIRACRCNHPKAVNFRTGLHSTQTCCSLLGGARSDVPGWLA